MLFRNYIHISPTKYTLKKTRHQQTIYNTMKSVLRGHLWKKKSGLIKQVTS